MISVIALTPQDLDIATRTVIGEASNQAIEGRVGVAWTIRNRAQWLKPAWWGTTIKDVCLKPEQYDCWMETLGGEPNADYHRIVDMSPTDPQYLAAEIVVYSVMSGAIADPTRGSTTYKVRGTKAFWDVAVAGVAPVSIGAHDFWRLDPFGPCLAFLAPMTDGIHGTG